MTASVDDFFDDAYLRFYRPHLADEIADHEAGVMRRLLALGPDDRVLDAPAGEGRIARALARAGLTVVAVDASEAFLREARRRRDAESIAMEIHRGDLRDLPWSLEFDAVLSWSTSFGYFEDDEENRRVLREYAKVLRPGGQLLLEPMNVERCLRAAGGGDERTFVMEDGDAVLVDRYRYEPLTARLHTIRTIFDARGRRTVQNSLRALTFPELGSWLEAAGFEGATAYDEQGEPFSSSSRRMVVVARRVG